MRVLYIDDDRVNALLFSETCRALSDEGLALEVETAASGAEALEIVAAWAPDALVIDLHLPDTDGHTLLARLQAQMGDRAVPAWLCTADDGPEVATAARRAGFTGCWRKPAEAATVHEALAAFMAPGTTVISAA